MIVFPGMMCPLVIEWHDDYGGNQFLLTKVEACFTRGKSCQVNYKPDPKPLAEKINDYRGQPTPAVVLD